MLFSCSPGRPRATKTCTAALTPPAPTALVTNVPPRRPPRPRREAATAPGTSRRRTPAKEAATTVGTTVRNPLRAAAAAPPPGGEGRMTRGRREPRGGAYLDTCTLSTPIRVAAWTESATCGGAASTKSGVINISVATWATSTSCRFPSSISPLPPSGRTGKEAQTALTMAADAADDASLGRRAARRHRAPPATAAPLHRAPRGTAAPRCLSRPATATRLRLVRPGACPRRLGRPATGAPHRPKGVFSRGHRAAPGAAPARRSQRAGRTRSTKT